jgi:hypothetical protein
VRNCFIHIVTYRVGFLTKLLKDGSILMPQNQKLRKVTRSRNKVKGLINIPFIHLLLIGKIILTIVVCCLHNFVVVNIKRLVIGTMRNDTHCETRSNIMRIRKVTANLLDYIITRGFVGYARCTAPAPMTAL